MTGTTRPAQTLAPLQLPAPASQGEISLFAALAARRTTRQIGATPLPLQLLANLLWAAAGVNRRAGPFGQCGKTAASASNSQEIDLYVALKEGVYRYDPQGHLLEPVLAQDLRAGALSPGQGGVLTSAPLQLLYVVDIDRLTHTEGFEEPGLQDPEVQKSYYYVDTGLMAGNVYLYAASQGLAAWFHNCDRAGVAQQLGLHAQQRVLFAQSIGFVDEA